MTRPSRNTVTDQPVTGIDQNGTVDRPVDGAVRPDAGTIGAPVVVIGATGTIGREIVRALVGTGRPVVAVAPNLDRLQSLARTMPAGAVSVVAAHVRDERTAAEFAAGVRALGRPLAGVVTAFPTGKAQPAGGNRGRGRLLDQSADSLCDCFEQTVLAQMALARQLIPLLAEAGRNGRYVIVGGPGSETPWAGYGPRSVAMAATRMLGQVLHEEAHALGVRVHLVSIDAPVRGDEPGLHECPEWPTASGIARRVMQLLAPGAEPAGPVVACGRKAARELARLTAQTFRGVPAFLESLRTATRNE